jgi:thiol-disulfide isomerase/thioredoxin
MKPINYFFLLLTGLLGLRCQKPPIDYNTAMDSCKPDTMEMYRSNDTLKMPYLKEVCIIGAQLPEFEDTTLDGKKINKAYLTGKVSVINFWFIGCHPCEAEMPGFNKLVEKYKSDHVNFLSISRNSPKDVQDFVAEHPFNFDHIAYGEPIIMGNFISKWGYPLTIVADQNLKILYAKSGGRDDSLAVVIIQKELTPVIDEALKGI